MPTTPPPSPSIIKWCPGSRRYPPKLTTVDGEQEVAGEGKMALPGRSLSFSVLLLFFISYIYAAAGGIVGVDYGRDANNLIPPDRVVELLKTNGIGAAAIYDSDSTVIRAFAGSGIKLTVALPNDKLQDAANSPQFAGDWVWWNVGVHYPATQIRAVAVGNEVSHQRPDLISFLVPAMWNVYNAINNLGRAGEIKVSTPVAFSAVDRSFPPSQGSFRGDLQPVMRQILDFIRRTDSYFMVNLYPFITYTQNPQIDLNYALGLPNAGVRDPVTGLTYYSLLDAQLDALYSAMAALGVGGTVGGPANKNPPLRAALKETGHPSGKEGKLSGALPLIRSSTSPAGGRSARKVALERTEMDHDVRNASLGRERGANVENAQAYNGNLVQRILSGKTGTPLYADADMDVYIFSLFNENLKQGPATERSFGVFYPDGTKVYDVSFRAWCVANTAVDWKRLQDALDWACSTGGADCGPIQPGAACYEPNTLQAHASYAMNSYYQRRGHAKGTCDFNGAAQVVFQQPRFGNCDLPYSS